MKLFPGEKFLRTCLFRRQDMFILSDFLANTNCLMPKYPFFYLSYLISRQLIFLSNEM